MPVRPRRSWRAEVTRYQWLVLAIASAGWVFDVFEGQIFNITRDQMLSDLLGVGSGDPAVIYWATCFSAFFLAGGTIGGLAARLAWPIASAAARHDADHPVYSAVFRD